MRKLIVGSNLKMYKNITNTQSYLERLGEAANGISRDEITIFIIPSYIALERSIETAAKNGILIGAQNMHHEEEGAFTGEISVKMLCDMGIDLVMIGHSERRHVFAETDAVENLKVLSALKHGLRVLLCVGETAQQKADGIVEEVLRTQLKIGLKGVSVEQLNDVWVAYEPVWAVGEGGSPATPEYAQDRHAEIKRTLAQMFGEVGGDIPVLYGGSVNAENACRLIKCNSVDGLFIGRSAWEADAFNSIIREVLPVFRDRNL